MTTEEQIDRACKPQVGDTYKRGAYGARVVAVDSAFVLCVSSDGGEFEIHRNDWPRLAKNTICGGATFAPAGGAK
jgi:hypothetical protein